MKIKNIILVSVIPVLFSLNFISCGKKADLTLPKQIFPVHVKSFNVKQIGDKIQIKWNFPEFLSDGKTETDITKISKIYIYSAGGEIEVEKFLKKKKLLFKTDIGSLKKDRGYFKINIPLKLKELDRKKYLFSMLYKYGRKKSPLGKILDISTRIPLKAVNNLKIFKESKIIVLKWKIPDTNYKGDKVSEILGFNIYRKIISSETPQENPDYKKISTDLITENKFDDSDTGNNGTYFYYVKVKISDKVFSEDSNIVSIKTKDIYPPQIPSNLTVFKADDHIFVSWTPVKDKDLSHYRIYRKISEKSNYKMIADNITINTYKDTKVIKGKTYYYVVTSVDGNGNESDNSNSSHEEF